jgi:hypothetical protein
VSRAQTVFDERGKIVDEAVKQQLEQFLHGFIEFVSNSSEHKQLT